MLWIYLGKKFQQGGERGKVLPYSKMKYLTTPSKCPKCKSRNIFRNKVLVWKCTKCDHYFSEETLSETEQHDPSPPY